MRFAGDLGLAMDDIDPKIKQTFSVNFLNDPRDKTPLKAKVNVV
jgi:hypothetical protein